VIYRSQDRLAQEDALGIEETETLPELSEAEVLDSKRHTVLGTQARTGRRPELTLAPTSPTKLTAEETIVESRPSSSRRLWHFRLTL
jgi:hypothetical protein